MKDYLENSLFKTKKKVTLEIVLFERQEYLNKYPFICSSQEWIKNISIKYTPKEWCFIMMNNKKQV